MGEPDRHPVRPFPAAALPVVAAPVLAFPLGVLSWLGVELLAGAFVLGAVCAGWLVLGVVDVLGVVFGVEV